MIEYLEGVTISFIILQVSCYLTKDGWDKITKSEKDIIEDIFYSFVICAIPIFRELIIIAVLIIGFSLENDEIAEEFKEIIENSEK